MTSHLDVLTIGRVGIDLYPLWGNVALKDVQSFSKFLGRSPTNVAVGETEPRRAAKALLDTGVQIAIVKQGPNGVLTMTDEVAEVPPTPAPCR